MPGGRPKNPVVRQGAFVAIVDASLDRLKSLGQWIQSDFPDAPQLVVDALVQAAIHYELNANIKSNAPLMVRRQGRRPEIAVQHLLIECAELHKSCTGESVEATLAKLGGWAESDDGCIYHPIIQYAEAVLNSVGEFRSYSWRRQIRGAIDRYRQQLPHD